MLYEYSGQGSTEWLTIEKISLDLHKLVLSSDLEGSTLSLNYLQRGPLMLAVLELASRFEATKNISNPSFEAGDTLLILPRYLRFLDVLPHDPISAMIKGQQYTTKGP